MLVFLDQHVRDSVFAILTIKSTSPNGYNNGFFKEKVGTL